MSELLKLYKYQKLQIINIFLFCNILLILFKSIFSGELLLFEFKFSEFLELNDENYLLCSEKGIYIYDPELKNQISQYNFTEEITEREKFKFVTMSQYSNEDGGEIIVLYENKFYLFSSSGDNIIDSDINIPEQKEKYYTLVPYKNNSEYNFIISYLDKNQKFNIIIYNINKSEKSINPKINVNISLPIQSGLSSDITTNWLSCHFMNSDKYGKVLTCFYMINNGFSLCSFNIDELSIIDGLSKIFNDEIWPSFIQSDVSEDKTKALICFLDETNNNGYCINYNINKHEISNLVKYANSCYKDLFGLKVYYSKKNKEFIFSCFDYDSNFTFVKFDENFINNEISPIYITSKRINDCFVQFFSIIYLHNSKNYSILTSCDGSSKGTKYYSLSDEFNQAIKFNYDSEIISSSNTDNISCPYIDSSTISENSSKTYNKYYYNEEKYETINQKCADEFLYENKNSNECLKTCNYSQFLNDNCFINHLTNENINIITQEIKNIINNTYINQNINIVIEGENAIYQIISSLNMDENENKNISIIDFGECETKLKKIYDIDYLLILKIDTKLSNYNTILNYEIYNPNTKEKLNLSLCDNIKINIKTNYFPSQESLNKIIKLNESGYDLYDINNSFYNDLCSPFTTDNCTDILLSDRIIDYYENVSLCENGCDYKQYDYITKIVECECSIKKEIEIYETEVNPKNILSFFIDVDNFSNIKVLKCFKLVFSKRGQTNNKGSYIFFSIIFILIVLYIIFQCTQIHNIIAIFKKIIKIDNYINNKKDSPIKKKLKKRNSVIIFKQIDKSKSNNITKKNFTFSSSNKIIITKKNLKNIKNNNKLIRKGSKMKEKKQINYKYNDEELNSLEYYKAIKYDKRTYCQYYYSLLLIKHLFFFTFFNIDDYNIFIIKLALFIFSFSLYFSVNALFFVDKTMHNIYKSEGQLGLLSHIPHIFYSTIISSIISITIKMLALSNKDMLKIKQINNNEKAIKESSILFDKLKIKFNLFFLFNFILLLLFWYFISAFCAVYKNTQIILIKNTLSSFVLSLLYPLGLNLIPGLLRIPALKSESQNKELLYKFSQIIAFI